MLRLGTGRIFLILFTLIVLVIAAWVQSEFDGPWYFTLIIIVAIILGALAVISDLLGLLDRVRGSVEKAYIEPTRDPALLEQCGERPIDLGDQRLVLSAAFGTYLVNLLESPRNFVGIPGQLRARSEKRTGGIDLIFQELTKANGARIVILAAAGGMGKSTLVSRLARCLKEREEVDQILGDSAKSSIVNPASGTLASVSGGFISISDFLAKLRDQLGLPPGDQLDPRQNLRGISDRLVGRRTLIIIDNLETIENGEELTKAALALTSRDVRVVVTTRRREGEWTGHPNILIADLNPINTVSDTHRFLKWHISRFASTNPNLANIDLTQNNNLETLIEKTGGNPLLMQIVISEIAQLSWSFLDDLPELFGAELLDYLYRQFWDELVVAGQAGRLAIEILGFVDMRQYLGKRVTFPMLRNFAEERGLSDNLSEALDLLFARFLLINDELQKGDFNIVPSLSQFVRHQLQ